MARIDEKITPFLWFDDQAEQAANFYVSLFDDSESLDVSRYPEGVPGRTAGDAMTVEYLRTEYGKYFASMDEHVRELNKKYGNRVFVTPVGQAVVALREKVIAGEAPGIKKQSELFTDAIGHCTAPIKVLNAYCHYAVAYRRSPVGLPVPGALGRIGDEATTAKLNTLLQEIAWKAATSHPLSGIAEK